MKGGLFLSQLREERKWKVEGGAFEFMIRDMEERKGERQRGTEYCTE